MSASDEIIVGLDGWLFLQGGSNQVMSNYTDPTFFSDEKIAAWTSLLDDRARMLADHGIPYFHMVAPDKISVYPEYVGLAELRLELSPTARLNAVLGGRPFWVDITQALQEAKARHNVYLKTDTHWTFQGCYAAYLELCRKIGVPPDTTIPERPSGHGMLALDLGAKHDPVIKEEATFYNILQRSSRVSENRMVRYNERWGLTEGAPLFQGCQAIFRNDKPMSDRKVLLFGDSFSEFRHTQLSAMLAETFREVEFLWSPSLDFEHVLKSGADIVISEMAERFCNTVPVDQEGLLAAAESRLASFLADNTHITIDLGGDGGEDPIKRPV